jgi:catechol 2,3-dioxygenase-like lactoylglutathione lyase family enzyme
MFQLDHVAVQVTDLDAAIAFYTEKLGLELLYTKIDRAHHEAFAFLQLAGGRLELLQRVDVDGHPQPRSKPPIAEPFCPHIALSTRDLDQLIERLGQAAISIVKGPLEIPATVRWLYVADPDNNIIEFVQWISPS